MKKFIRTTIVFSVIYFFCLLSFMILYKYKISNITINKNKSIIVCGDSHTQTAINDGIFQKAINISQSSEHFLYTYNLLRLLIKKNPHIKTVMLGVSYHSFAEGFDKVLENERPQSLGKYLISLDLESLNRIVLLKPKNVEHAVKTTLHNSFIDCVKANSIHDYSFVGSFYSSNKSNYSIHTIKESIDRHFYTKDFNLQEFAVYQVYYLNKIATLCNTYGVKLVLINTPLHLKYYRGIPKKFIKQYNLIIDNILVENKNIRVMDFHAFKLPDHCFGDADHLNFKGSEIFTNFLTKEKI